MTNGLQMAEICRVTTWPSKKGTKAKTWKLKQCTEKGYRRAGASRIPYWLFERQMGIKAKVKGLNSHGFQLFRTLFMEIVSQFFFHVALSIVVNWTSHVQPSTIHSYALINMLRWLFWCVLMYLFYLSTQCNLSLLWCQGLVRVTTSWCSRTTFPIVISLSCDIL